MNKTTKTKIIGNRKSSSLEELAKKARSDDCELIDMILNPNPRTKNSNNDLPDEFIEDTVAEGVSNLDLSDDDFGGYLFYAVTDLSKGEKHFIRGIDLSTRRQKFNIEVQLHKGFTPFASGHVRTLKYIPNLGLFAGTKGMVKHLYTADLTFIDEDYCPVDNSIVLELDLIPKIGFTGLAQDIHGQAFYFRVENNLPAQGVHRKEFQSKDDFDHYDIHCWAHNPLHGFFIGSDNGSVHKIVDYFGGAYTNSTGIVIGGKLSDLEIATGIGLYGAIDNKVYKLANYHMKCLNEPKQIASSGKLQISKLLYIPGTGLLFSTNHKNISLVSSLNEEKPAQVFHKTEGVVTAMEYVSKSQVTQAIEKLNA
ncbi:hypothetical protein HOK51_07525 [Candidatus Woesearchaeota archaeon]|jgi:hypothetical protein|nr:hypothetical protein [Candidatus Woesearchaeota archaeon]MBT6519673.1 hypothetical protein [Candidatus Woesearchaeota archaeon]MBT7367364.1 hypothetical protein [Candidatus Woesearchaeota archaeon]